MDYFTKYENNSFTLAILTLPILKNKRKRDKAREVDTYAASWPTKNWVYHGKTAPACRQWLMTSTSNSVSYYKMEIKPVVTYIQVPHQVACKDQTLDQPVSQLGLEVYKSFPIRLNRRLGGSTEIIHFIRYPKSTPNSCWSFLKINEPGNDQDTYAPASTESVWDDISLPSCLELPDSIWIRLFYPDESDDLEADAGVGVPSRN